VSVRYGVGRGVAVAVPLAVAAAAFGWTVRSLSRADVA